MVQVTYSATTPELGGYASDLAEEDKEIARLMDAAHLQSKAGLWATRRRIKEVLKKTRTLLQALRKHKKDLLRELKQRLSEAKKVLRARKTEIRAQFKRDFAAVLAQEKAAAVGYDKSRETIERDHGAALGALAKRKRELESARSRIESLDGSAGRREKAYMARRERESESTDAVTYELEKVFPEALPWWHQNKNKRQFAEPKKSAKMSRAEVVLHYLHENPEKVDEARIKAAEQQIKTHEGREKALSKQYQRTQLQRSARRGSAVRRAGQRSGQVTYTKRLEAVRKREQKPALEDVPFLPLLGPWIWPRSAEEPQPWTDEIRRASGCATMKINGAALLVGGLLLVGLAALASDDKPPRKPPQPQPPPPQPQPPPAGGDGPPGLSPRELALWSALEPSTREFVREVLARARAAGLAPRLTSGRRSCAEQNRLYAQGRTAPGAIVTHARGCQSWHVAGRAVDVTLGASAPASEYAKIGAIGKELGGKWGGDFPGFPDLGHLEYHPGLRIEDVCPNPDNCTDPVS